MNTVRGNFGRFTALTALWLCLSGLFAPGAAVAQQPAPGRPGYFPMPMPGPYNTFQNQPPAAVPGNFSRPQASQPPFGAPYPWRPPPGYQPQQQPQAQATTRPYVETSVESASAYVHQSLVMTVQVFSPVNLKTIAVELQDSDDVIFRQLGDVTASAQTRQGQQAIVNTLYYQLTPLRSGRIELAPVRVTGIIDANTPGRPTYDAVASQPVALMVLDPVPDVQPWLPLQELELSASLSNDEQVGAGEPLTLTIEQRAVGMSGAQLPSIETQLQGPGHRLYREQSEYEGTITSEGKLIGTRVDRFTLVPQQGDRVAIPAIRLDWWNVERQRKETAVLPSRLLNETERGFGEQGRAGGLQRGGIIGSVLIWLPLLAIAFLLGRFWPRLAPGLRVSGHRLWQRVVIVGQPLQHRLAVVSATLSPRRNLHRLRRHIANSLPRSARLWFCVRSADDEQDPDDWSQVLRFLINRRLGLPAQLPMSRLAEHIIEIHPGADPDRIRMLLGELEAALFSGQAIGDFTAWKREFKHQVRPRLFAPLRRRYLSPRRAALPDLNPAG